MLEDYCKANNTNYEIVNSKDLAIYLNKANEQLLEFAINSYFNSTNKIEFYKLKKELDNIDYEVSNGVIKLIRKDTNIDKNRVTCYLQYFNGY